MLLNEVICGLRRSLRLFKIGKWEDCNHLRKAEDGSYRRPVKHLDPATAGIANASLCSYLLTGQTASCYKLHRTVSSFRKPREKKRPLDPEVLGCGWSPAPDLCVSSFFSLLRDSYKQYHSAEMNSHSFKRSYMNHINMLSLLCFFAVGILKIRRGKYFKCKK